MSRAFCNAALALFLAAVAILAFDATIPACASCAVRLHGAKDHPWRLAMEQCGAFCLLFAPVLLATGGVLKLAYSIGRK